MSQMGRDWEKSRERGFSDEEENKPQKKLDDFFKEED